jgi:hypothetical protein
MKLLVEEIVDTQCLVEETSPGQKSYFITGPFMQAEVKNKNGRVYPKNILEREVNRYVREQINERRALGELAHPQGPNINHDRVSHLVTEMKQSGNDFYGKAKILTEMPCGKIVKALIDEGIKFGVSSRGVGTLKRLQDGTNIVEDNYHLAVAADIVHDPSAPAAWATSLFESKEWIFDAGIWREAQINEAKSQIDEVSRSDREAKILRLFESFISGQRI